MTTATEPTTSFFQTTFDNLRKMTESTLQMQQQLYREWAKMWPGLTPAPEDLGTGMQRLQREWGATVTDMMRKHREIVDRQYQTGISSLEDAFRVAESKDPTELRDRCEALCRNALSLVRESSETQMRQFQDAMNKWVELCQMKR